MKVTVLPVRDPARPEPRASASPGPSAGRGGSFDGMHSVSVELLRAERRRHVPQRPRTPEPPPAPAPAAPPAPAAVEIELPNGRIVRVPPGFDSGDLERVLAIAAAEDPSSSTT